MTDTVLLRNIGKSEIHIAHPDKKLKGKIFIFKPGAVIHFSEEQAEKLRKLYPQTVVGQEQALDPFKLAEDAAAKKATESAK